MTKIVCYDILPTLGPSFFGRQPTEHVNERMVVQFVGWQARLGFDLKVGVSLDKNVFSTDIVSLHPAVYKWVVSLDKARGTKVMLDRSRNVTKDL